MKLPGENHFFEVADKLHSHLGKRKLFWKKEDE